MPHAQSTANATLHPAVTRAAMLAVSIKPSPFACIMVGAGAIPGYSSRVDYQGEGSG